MVLLCCTGILSDRNISRQHRPQPHGRQGFSSIRIRPGAHSQPEPIYLPMKAVQVHSPACTLARVEQRSSAACSNPGPGELCMLEPMQIVNRELGNWRVCYRESRWFCRLNKSGIRPKKCPPRMPVRLPYRMQTLTLESSVMCTGKPCVTVPTLLHSPLLKRARRPRRRAPPGAQPPPEDTGHQTHQSSS